MPNTEHLKLDNCVEALVYLARLFPYLNHKVLSQMAKRHFESFVEPPPNEVLTKIKYIKRLNEMLNSLSDLPT